MSELKLLDGYSIDNAAELPQMSFPKMFWLALRTWPYMKPMLPHLLVLLAFYFSGGLLALLTGLIGTDLFTNKVLVGEKLQPIQAIVLFVGDEYVTTDPEKLGKGVSKKTSSKGTKTKGIVFAGKKDSTDLDDIEPELTQEQRRGGTQSPDPLGYFRRLLRQYYWHVDVVLLHLGLAEHQPEPAGGDG